MSDFLAAIVAERLERVRQDAERGASRAALRAEAEARRDDHRPFLSALRREAGAPVRVIAEVKRASPSAGMLQKDYDPAALARAYHACGAAAISVLTEPGRFLGSLGDLAAVRDAVPLPVLMKDFIVNERQIYEAGASGADAALLIVAALDARQLGDYAALLVELGIAPLIEIHDARDLDTALTAPGALGVNNRDLRTLAMRAGHAELLLPLLPPDRVRVAESGYKDRAGIERIERLGADAVLVGETLLRADRPATAFAALFGGAQEGGEGSAEPGRERT